MRCGSVDPVDQASTRAKPGAVSAPSMPVTRNLADSTAALADLLMTVQEMARSIPQEEMEAATSNSYLHMAPVPFASRVLPLLLRLRDGSKPSNVLAANAPYFGAEAT